MQISDEGSTHMFRTPGQVNAIYQADNLTGFYWTEEREDTMHLHGLFLKPGYQGQGIGTAVLDKLSGDYSGKMNKIDLGVYQGNVDAIRSYEHEGFCITRALDDLHFYLMQKPLAKQAIP
jgi:ribosomal protein S18 acetylase RimI-like enzyme